MRRVSGGGKHPDCRDGTPLRGGSRDGDLGRRSHAEGTPAFRGHDCPTTTGCSTRFGGGERQPLSHGLPRDSDDVPSLRADRPTLAYSHGLTHPRRNRRWTRDAASHAAPRSCGLPCPIYRQACTCSEDGPDGAVWLAACCPSEGRQLSHAARFERIAREAEADATARALNKEPQRWRGRGSDARGRARASFTSLQKSTDSVRRREADALHFTRSGGVQGRASSSRPTCESTVAAGEETLAPCRGGTSRDRFRHRVRPVQGAGGWRWKASWTVVVGESSRIACKARSRQARRLRHRGSGAGATGTRQGCQRHGGIGSARKKTPRVNPGPPAEADRAS